MARRFEQRFEGKDNAGLRAEIRRVVSGAYCGPENGRIVRGLANRIALTAAGRSTLDAVAADYEAANASSKATCDCAACYAGNLQRLGALG